MPRLPGHLWPQGFTLTKVPGHPVHLFLSVFFPCLQKRPQVFRSELSR